MHGGGLGLWRARRLLITLFTGLITPSRRDSEASLSAASVRCPLGPDVCPSIQRRHALVGFEPRRRVQFTGARWRWPCQSRGVEAAGDSARVRFSDISRAASCKATDARATDSRRYRATGTPRFRSMARSWAVVVVVVVGSTALALALGERAGRSAPASAC